MEPPETIRNPRERPLGQAGHPAIPSVLTPNSPVAPALGVSDLCHPIGRPAPALSAWVWPTESRTLETTSGAWRTTRSPRTPAVAAPQFSPSKAKPVAAPVKPPMMSPFQTFLMLAPLALRIGSEDLHTPRPRIPHSPAITSRRKVRGRRGASPTRATRHRSPSHRDSVPSPGTDDWFASPFRIYPPGDGTTPIRRRYSDSKSARSKTWEHLAGRGTRTGTRDAGRGTRRHRPPTARSSSALVILERPWMSRRRASS